MHERSFLRKICEHTPVDQDCEYSLIEGQRPSGKLEDIGPLYPCAVVLYEMENSVATAGGGGEKVSLYVDPILVWANRFMSVRQLRTF